jgi:hypothetical protein
MLTKYTDYNKHRLKILFNKVFKRLLTVGKKLILKKF